VIEIGWMCVDDMRKSSRYAFSLSSSTYSWASKKQQMKAQSTAKAKYISISLATSQAMWLRIILEDVGEKLAKRSYSNFVSKEIHHYYDKESHLP
jgi:hypothetical protein